MNKRCELPTTEYLLLLKTFLVKEIQVQIDNVTPTYAEYVYLTHILITRIALFNKRRVNEVSELKVSDFKMRLKGDELDTNTEIYNSLAVSEKALLKRYCSIFLVIVCIYTLHASCDSSLALR